MQKNERGADATWVLTAGAAGMRSQAAGLADAVGLPVVEKLVTVASAWGWLPPNFPIPLSAITPSGSPLAPPWPRLLICCGGRSIAPALAVKRASGNRVTAVYVQDPGWAAKHFDLIIAMPHDAVSGANVVTIRTALNRVTPAGLDAAQRQWEGQLSSGGRALVGVLVGGDSGRYRLSERVLHRLVGVLANAHAAHGIAAAITPSRRTREPVREFLRGRFRTKEWAFFWDQEDPNPYLGILAASKRLIVTGESISMISEALAAGIPVHVLPLEGRGRRHEAFVQRLVSEGMISMIKGDDLDWRFSGPGVAVNATPAAAQRVRTLLALT